MSRAISVSILFTFTAMSAPCCQFGQAVAAPQPADELTPGELIDAATQGEGFPRQPCLSMEMRGLAANEIAASPDVRAAYEKLAAANRRELAEISAIAALEKEEAIWCLLSCLAGPHGDNHIEALRSLERLGDRRAVPFLLIFAEYMAVIEGGSENATIHGIVHQSVAKTLSTLTGVEVTVNGQDPEGLKRGIKKWRKWLVEYEQTHGDTAGTENSNTVQVTSAGKWKPTKIRVFRTGQKTAEVVDGKRRVYELSSEGRPWTYPVIAFAGPSSGKPWIGPEQDGYIDTGTEVEGFRTIGKRIQWHESMITKEDKEESIAEILTAFDRELKAGGLRKDPSSLQTHATRLGSHIKNQWMFTRGPYNSQAAPPKITWGQMDGGALKLDLTDQLGIFKATVWIDVKSKEVTRVVEETGGESDD